MLSLAAINYRDIFTSAGGPIERVSSGSIDVLGKMSHQANAYLAPGLIRGKPTLSVYGNADGTGANGTGGPTTGRGGAPQVDATAASGSAGGSSFSTA